MTSVLMNWKWNDMKRIIHFAFAATFIAALASASTAQAAALPKFNAFSQSASGLADFEQTVYDRAQKVVQKSKGTFAFSRPGKFRWTYDKPAQLIVGDGAKVWIYDADLNQVTVRKLDKAVSSTPASLLTGDGKIEVLFDLAEQGVQDGIEWLEAKPKKPDTGFDRIRIGFAGDTLAAMELFDQFGTRTLLKFSNLRRNAAPDPGLFKFTPPKGADVLSD
jgi:outer membrane lipoprotein carrier protein